MTKAIVWAVFLLPALIIVIGIPLALQMVAPNHWYGFRTPAALSSTELWYGLNRTLGILLILSGSAGLVFSAIYWRWVEQPTEAKIGICLGVTAVLIVIASVAPMFLRSN